MYKILLMQAKGNMLWNIYSDFVLEGYRQNSPIWIADHIREVSRLRAVVKEHSLLFVQSHNKRMVYKLICVAFW